MNDSQILDWLESNFERVTIGRDDMGDRVFRRLVKIDTDNRGLPVRTYGGKEYIRLRDLVIDAIGVVPDPVKTGQNVPDQSSLPGIVLDPGPPERAVKIDESKGTGT